MYRKKTKDPEILRDLSPTEISQPIGFIETRHIWALLRGLAGMLSTISDKIFNSSSFFNAHHTIFLAVQQLFSIGCGLIRRTKFT